MPLPVIADTFRCTIHYLADDGATAVNVIHVFDAGGTASESDVGDAIVAAWPNHMMTGIPSGVVADYIDVIKLDGVSATVRTVTGSSGEFVGEQTGNYLPAVASLVKLQTGLRGRERRGRVFRPFAAEETATNGLLDPTNVGLLQVAWETFLANLAVGAVSLILCVASYKLADQKPVTAVVAESPFGTQRRRQQQLR